MPSATPGSPADVNVAILPTIDAVIDLKWLGGQISAALDEIDTAVARVSVLIVEDELMAQMHVRHSGIEGSTDVLTFPANRHDAAIDVDIAICLDEARRHCDLRGHPLERELLLYALHGVLHCAGFDDHEDADYKAIHAEEDRILEAIGVGATFRGVDPAGEGASP